MVSVFFLLFGSRRVSLCAGKHCIAASFLMVVYVFTDLPLAFFHSTMRGNPERAGKCGTRLWLQRHCLRSPTSSAPCASSASSPPTPTLAPYRSHWAACSWTSSSSSSFIVSCCWPLPMASTSSTFIMKQMEAIIARVFAVVSKTTPSQRKFLNKLSQTNLHC